MLVSEIFCSYFKQYKGFDSFKAGVHNSFLMAGQMAVPKGQNVIF